MLARAQATCNRTAAAPSFMNQFDGLGTIAHGYAESHNLAVDSVQSRVPGTCTRVTGTPLGRATEVAVHNQAVVLERLVYLDALALDEVAVLAAFDACPGYAEMSKFPNGDGRTIGKYARDLLVGAPV